MIIGTLREVRVGEYRVGLTPQGAKELIEKNHKVLIEKNAGLKAGFPDQKYKEAGAIICKTPEEIAKKAELIVKVKQPAPEEYKLLDKFQGKFLFSLFHLAGRPVSFIERLLENKITALDYLTVKDEKGEYPILKVLREISGILAVQYGAEFLQEKYQGLGTLINSIENTKDTEVVIIGGGITGSKAAAVAAGLGAKVTLLEINEKRLEEVKKELKDLLGHSLFHNITFLKSNDKNVSTSVKKADLLIGAASIHGERAPLIVKEEMVKKMKKGSVIVDTVVSQGGCVWGSKVTTSLDPIYHLNGIIYCGIENLAGETPLQGTQSLVAVTLPFIKKLAEKGIEALREDKNFANGVHTYKGKITYKPVAEYFNLMDNYVSFAEIE